MDAQSLLFADIAELLNINIADVVADLNVTQNSYWDSLAIVSLIGCIDNYYSISVTGEELNKIVNIADILTLIEQKSQETA